MEQDTFAVGDVVWLNSGGPPMTVTALNFFGSMVMSVNAAWFDLEDKHHEARFRLETLRKTEPSQ